MAFDTKKFLADVEKKEEIKKAWFYNGSSNNKKLEPFNIENPFSGEGFGFLKSDDGKKMDELAEEQSRKKTAWFYNGSSDNKKLEPFNIENPFSGEGFGFLKSDDGKKLDRLAENQTEKKTNELGDEQKASKTKGAEQAWNYVNEVAEEIYGGVKIAETTPGSSFNTTKLSMEVEQNKADKIIRNRIFERFNSIPADSSDPVLADERNELKSICFGLYYNDAVGKSFDDIVLERDSQAAALRGSGQDELADTLEDAYNYAIGGAEYASNMAVKREYEAKPDTTPELDRLKKAYDEATDAYFSWQQEKSRKGRAHEPLSEAFLKEGERLSANREAAKKDYDAYNEQQEKDYSLYNYAKQGIISNEKYAQLKNNADFEEKSKYIEGVTPKANVFDTSFKGELAPFLSSQGVDNYGSDATIKYTEEEKKIIYYLINTEGKEAAKEFMKSIEGRADDRAGKKIQEFYEDNVFVGTLATIGANIDNFIEKPAVAVSSIFNPQDYYFPNSIQVAADEFYRNAGENEKLWYGVVGGVADMAPSIALTLYGGGIAKGAEAVGTKVLGKTLQFGGRALFATQTYGSYYSDAINEGKSRFEAMANAGIMAGLEFVTETWIGGLAGFGKSGVSRAASAFSKTGAGQKIMSKVSGSLSRIGVSAKGKALLSLTGKYIGDMASEGAEEWLTEFISPIVRNITYGENNSLEFMTDEQIDSFIIGALTAGFLNGAGSVYTGVKISKNELNAKIYNIENSNLSKAEKVLAIKELEVESTIKFYANLGMQDGMTYEEAKKLAEKEGLDLEEYEDIAKAAFEAGALKVDKELNKEIVDENIEMLIESGADADKLVKEITKNESLRKAFVTAFGLDGADNATVKKAARQYANGVISNGVQSSVATGVNATIGDMVTKNEPAAYIAQKIKENDGFVVELLGGPDVDGAVTDAKIRSAVRSARNAEIAREINRRGNLSESEQAALIREYIARDAEIDLYYENGFTGVDFEKVKSQIGQGFLSEAEKYSAYVRGENAAKKIEGSAFSEGVVYETPEERSFELETSAGEHTVKSGESENTPSDFEERAYSSEEGAEAIPDAGEKGVSIYKRILPKVLEAASEKSGKSVSEIKADVQKIFAKIYNAGKKGLDFKKSFPGSYFTEAEARAIYEAGAVDASAENEVLYKTDPHVIQDPVFKSMKLSPKTFQKLLALAKITGMNIRFDAELEQNAAFVAAKGEIVISTKCKNPVMVAALHEVVHVIRKATPADYNNLSRAVLSVLKKKGSFYQKVLKEYMEVYYPDLVDENGKWLDSWDEFTNEEIVADMVSMLLADSETVRNLGAKEAKGLARVIEALKELREKIIAKLRGMENLDTSDLQKAALKSLSNDIEKIENAFATALRNTASVAKAGTEIKTSKEVKTKVYETVKSSRSVKEKNFVEDKYFARNADKWDNLQDGSHLKVGKITVDSVLAKIGIPNGELYFDVSKIKKSMKDHKDHLTPAILKGIPAMLNDPIVITEYKPGKNFNTVNVYGNLYANGVPVTVGIVVTVGRRGNIISNIRTVHARSNLKNQITDESVLYLKDNKKETNAWFKAYVGNDVPGGGTQFGVIRSIDFINIIRQENKIVKPQNNVRNSISHTKKGEPVVVVDTNILKGVDESLWKQKVKEVIKGFYPSLLFKGGEAEVKKRTYDEYLKSRYTNSIKKFEKDVYEDKLRASNHLDEILLSVRDTRIEDLNHERSDNIKGFVHGDVRIVVGDNKYMADAVVGIKEDGSMLVYDVVDFMPAEFELSEQKEKATVRSSRSHNETFSKKSDEEESYSFEDNSDEGNENAKKAEQLSEADFRRLLEKVQNGELENSSYVPMRATTPEFFIDVVREHSRGNLNVMNVPMAATVEHMRQNMEEEEDLSYGERRPHNFSIDDIVTISKEMGHPAYIVLQKNGRYAMVVSFYNKAKKRVVVSIDFASDKDEVKNYKYQQYMNGYNGGYYNIIVTQFEPDDLSRYLKVNEVVYDKKKMNGKYQVGSGRIVTFTHDTPFIEDSLSHPYSESNDEIVNNDDISSVRNTPHEEKVERDEKNNPDKRYSRSRVNYADETDDGTRSMTSEEARSEAIRAALGQFDRRERALDRWGMNIQGSNEGGTGMSLEAAVIKAKKSFGIPIVHGGNANVAGETASASYNKDAKTIRTKFKNDLPAIAHAIGYHIDEKLKLTDAVLEQTERVRNTNGDGIGKMESELIGLSPLSNDASYESLREGIAEFVRMYLTSKNLAMKAAPMFYSYFESQLETDESLLEAVEESAKAINGYFDQAFSERASSAVMTGKDWEELNKPRGKEKAEILRREFVARAFDKFYGIKVVLKDNGAFDLSSSEDAYVRATNSLLARARAAALLDNGFFDENGKRVGESFFDIIAPLGAESSDRYKAFGDYLVFTHALEWLEPYDLESAGLQTSKGNPISNAKRKIVFGDETLNDAERLRGLIQQIESKNPDFKEIAKKVYEYQDNLMKYYLIPSGALSKESAEKFKAQYPHYVPFNRFNSEYDKIMGRTKRAFANLNNPVKTAEGGSATIRNPLESIINSTIMAVDFKMKNDVMMSLITRFTGANGIPGVIERIYSTSELEKLSQEQNPFVTEESISTLAANDGNSKAYSPTVSGKEGIVSVWVNGEKRFYQIYDSRLYNSIAKLGVEELNGFFRFCNSLSNVMKATMTQYNPLFGLGNAVRDFYNFHLQTSSNANLLRQMVMYGDAILSMFKNDEDFQLYKALGGADSSRFRADMDTLQKAVRKRNIKHESFAKKLWYYKVGFSRMLDLYTGINEVIETAPRLAEFKYTRKTTGDTQLAMYRSQDVTTNFKRSGTWGKRINSIVLFSNASLQGVDKMIRNYTEAGYLEGSNFDKRKVAAKITKAVVFSIAMAALQEFWNRRDDEAEEEYGRLSEYIKNNYDVFYVGDGKFIKLPKEQNNSIPRVIMQRLFDMSQGDEVNLRELGGYIWSQMMPGFMPNFISDDPSNWLHSMLNSTAVGGIADVVYNRDYRGNEIVPLYMDGPDFEKHTDYTNWFAVKAAEKIYDVTGWDVSPMSIEHMIESYGNFYGTFATSLHPYKETEETVQSSGFVSGTWSTVWKNFLSATGARQKYVSDARYSTDLLNNFYDDAEKAEKELSRRDTGENAASNEKYSKMKNFMSSFNKLSKTGSEQQQRLDRKMLQIMLEGFDGKELSAGEKYAARLYDNTGIDEVFKSTYPKPEFSETIKKGKKKHVYTVSLDSNLYAQFCSDIDDMRERVRVMIRDLGLDDKDAAFLLSECYTAINNEVKARYLTRYGVSDSNIKYKQQKQKDEEKIIKEQKAKLKKLSDDAYEEKLNDLIYGDYGN